jgi:hypothetical protein
LKKISSCDFAGLCASYANCVCSLEDAELERALFSVKCRYDCIFWYPSEDSAAITAEIEKEVRIELLPYVGKIEKFVIRKKQSGSPITKKERKVWWKKQKERERKEFYKTNGYYENVDFKSGGDFVPEKQGQEKINAQLEEYLRVGEAIMKDSDGSKNE